MTISKSWFSYLTRAFALSLCTALLLSFVSCSYSTTSQEPKVKIILDANGGSFSETTETTQTLLIKKNQTSKLPTADELGLSCSNYNFTGWAKSQQGQVEFNDGDSITSATDLTLYAQWEAVNTTYTVRHLLQNLADDSYTEDEEAAEQKSGTYGTQTAAVAKTYEGFTATPIEQKTIQADSSTIVEIKYDRNTYTLSYSSKYGDAPTSKPVKYGYELTAADLPDLTQTNYNFKGWLFDGASITAGYTVKKDITLTAQWEAIYIVTKENFSEVLIGGSTIVVTGELTASDLVSMVNAIREKSIIISLDLSQTTGLTSIPDNTFTNIKLSGITIPDTVTSIGYAAFANCKSLSSVTIPDSVSSIGNQAFYGCRSLSSVTIPNSVTSIGDLAFMYCTSISSVTIPDSVTSIEYQAFYGCTSLSSVTIPDSVTSICDYAFSGCTSLSSVTIPDSVTSIGNRAFDSCTSLSSVTIPDSVTSIGDYAFYGCSKLTSLTFTDPTTWYRTYSSTNWNNKTGGTLTDVSDPATNATYFMDTYKHHYWYKLDE